MAIKKFTQLELNKLDTPGKRTSIGRGKVKTSSMNKTKRKAYKKYRGQG